MQWIIEATRDKTQQLPTFRDWTISEINSNTFTITDYTSIYEEYISYHHPRITTQISQLGIITITSTSHIETTLDIANPTTTPESIIAAIQHHQATILKSNLRYITDR